MIEPRAHTGKERDAALLSPRAVGRQAWRMMPGDAACGALLPGVGRREKWKRNPALSPHLQHLSPCKQMEGERVSYRATCHPAATPGVV